ncbi:hypothetical protein [Pantoea cypripedii]|nr:hypothetical protein [Pantoea cypripedii]MBP2199263.1 hypothetical protein [Pantoea cypripedii]
MKREMTVRALKERLSRYPDEALCCGTFWLADDFLQLEPSLDEDEIDTAMELASRFHDANVGFNREFLQWAIDEILEVRDVLAD